MNIECPWNSFLLSPRCLSYLNLLMSNFCGNRCHLEISPAVWSSSQAWAAHPSKANLRSLNLTKALNMKPYLTSGEARLSLRLLSATGDVPASPRAFQWLYTNSDIQTSHEWCGRIQYAWTRMTKLRRVIRLHLWDKSTPRHRRSSYTWLATTRSMLRNWHPSFRKRIAMFSKSSDWWMTSVLSLFHIWTSKTGSGSRKIRDGHQCYSLCLKPGSVVVGWFKRQLLPLRRCLCGLARKYSSTAYCAQLRGLIVDVSKLWAHILRSRRSPAVAWMFISFYTCDASHRKLRLTASNRPPKDQGSSTSSRSPPESEWRIQRIESSRF